MNKVQTLKETLSQKGRQWYHRLRRELEKKYQLGDYVAIEPESGKYVVGKTTIETMEKSQKQYPKKKFFIAQVGRLAGLMKWASTLSLHHHPRIVLKIKTRNAWKTIDCLIDTGFSSGLSLPEKLKYLIDQQITWVQDFELADGNTTNFVVYRIAVRYQGKEKILPAVFTKSNDALVGMEFLDGFRFILDLKEYTVQLA